MAVQETNLGHFDYIGLFNKDAVLTTSAGNIIGWKWKVPTSLNRRRSPSWFISIQSAYIDDSNGTGKALPHMLRLKVPAQNYHTYEEPSNTLSDIIFGYPIVAILVRDADNGHWYSLAQDNIVLQVPSTLQYLEFDILDGNGNVLQIDSIAGETLNMFIKVTYPERTEVMANTTQTYAQSMIGNIRPMNTF